ncbi:MAG: hypothetical protein JW900_10450 [Anaerolineae bacterium]|nr:hypothetical protein [Anaerolineae bacterium]
MSDAPAAPRTLEQSQQLTLAALQEVSDSTLIRLTRLTLPEIQQAKQEIARIFPAGNLPAFVLSGLAKLEGRQISPERVNSDLTALLRGVSLVPKGLYGAFVAAPASALHAYQKLLQLAGKDLSSAFPEGTWQFYLQFGLREDTSRHACETVGFHRVLPDEPDVAAMAGAWLCTALQWLYRFDDLLAADWGERVMLRIVLDQAARAGIADQAPFVTLTRDWDHQRPYHCPSGGGDYLAHRQALFQQFLQERLRALPPAAREDFGRQYRLRAEQELDAYQRQMTILAALVPERYREQRMPIPFWRASVGFVWQDRTYLLPLCQQDEQGSPLCYPLQVEGVPPTPLYALPDDTLCNAKGEPLSVDRAGRVRFQSGHVLGALRPPQPEAVMAWLAAILASPVDGAPSSLDLLLAETPRALQPQIRAQLPPATQAELAALSWTPIIINWDLHPSDLPLAYIRRGRRGIGDHALTILRTDRSIVFDQSHIFFDGMWGMAVAETMTDSAIQWYRKLSERKASPQARRPQPLALAVSAEAAEEIQAHRRRSEAAAESGDVDTRQLHRLRQYLQQRGVRLTVNDLLLLYRFFHAADYRLSPAAGEAVESLRQRARSPETQAALQALEVTLSRLGETNPVLLIPMDASNVSPQERVFPTTFRNPLIEIYNQWDTAWERYRAYRAQPTSFHWSAFDRTRRELLAYLGAFGEMLHALKGVTMRGESFNTATIRLLAHLPPSMQHLMDQIPQHIGVLNEIIKGSEVFSNVGRVAPGSTLARFISARDDGETKELIWGILSDDQGRTWISLRDFRPFVPLLVAAGESDLANLLARDYLFSYVEGFNRFLLRLGELVAAKAVEGRSEIP